MKYTATEIKAFTGKKSRAEAETALYATLGSREWRRVGRVYRPAGYARSRDLVHFTATWAVEGGGVGHSRVGIPLRLAVEGDGDLTTALVLH
jgi:hypothetical protein